MKNTTALFTILIGSVTIILLALILRELATKNSATTTDQSPGLHTTEATTRIEQLWETECYPKCNNTYRVAGHYGPWGRQSFLVIKEVDEVGVPDDLHQLRHWIKQVFRDIPVLFQSLAEQMGKQFPPNFEQELYQLTIEAFTFFRMEDPSGWRDGRGVSIHILGEDNPLALHYTRGELDLEVSVEIFKNSFLNAPQF